MEVDVVVIGPFPPPVHGMSKNLKIVTEDLEALVAVAKFDTSPASLVRGINYHYSKIKKYISNIIRLSYIKSINSVYMPPDGAFGAWYSLGYVAFVYGKTNVIFLHHRSFNYINNSALPYVLLNKFFGKKIINIFLCDCMATGYFEKYKKYNDYYVLSNVVHVLNNKPERSDTVDSICYLSNISEEKGIVRVIDAFKLLKSNGFNFKLKIGGKFEDKIIEKYVLDEINKDNSIIYCGFISDKKKFFSNCFAMFFPTDYRNEAQPNVIFESVSYGVPVFSVDRGCISSDLSGSMGFVVSLNEFAENILKIFLSLRDPVADLIEMGDTGSASVKKLAEKAVDDNSMVMKIISGINHRK